MTDTDAKIQEKYRRLKARLMGLDRVAVAFSGGIDSTLLLRTATDVLGENVLAVTAVSETTPAEDRKAAARFAGAIGVRYMVIPTDELRSGTFAANPHDRCYHCKLLRYGRLARTAADEGFSHIVDGENIDDLDDWRPGRRAARELGIISPLREAGLSKRDIRALARRRGIASWDRPASACLASRIPHGMEITEERLRRIDRAETYLRASGLAGRIRVRLSGDASARIELSDQCMERIVAEPFRTRVVQFFKDLGFRHIAVDLEGYRMGSLNPTPIDEDKA